MTLEGLTVFDAELILAIREKFGVCVFDKDLPLALTFGLVPELNDRGVGPIRVCAQECVDGEAGLDLSSHTGSDNGGEETHLEDLAEEAWGSEVGEEKTKPC